MKLQVRIQPKEKLQKKRLKVKRALLKVNQKKEKKAKMEN